MEILKSPQEALKRAVQLASAISGRAILGIATFKIIDALDAIIGSNFGTAANDIWEATATLLHASLAHAVISGYIELQRPEMLVVADQLRDQKQFEKAVTAYFEYIKVGIIIKKESHEV